MTSPPERRRRGQRLNTEIRDAVLAELAETGYRGLTMQAVARRAQTGKAPLYRRWPNKAELVLAVITDEVPGQSEGPVDAGSLRADLVALLRQMSRAMSEPVGQALYNLVLDLAVERDPPPGLLPAVIDRLLEPRLDAIMTAMRRAARRGEIRPAAVSELLARVGPALVIQQRIHLGTLPDGQEIDDIVDRVLLPAAGIRGES